MSRNRPSNRPSGSGRGSDSGRRSDRPSDSGRGSGSGKRPARAKQSGPRMKSGPKHTGPKPSGPSPSPDSPRPESKRPEGERPEGERIAKLLARAGVASRREVERMIAAGRIAINGKVLDTPATIIPDLAGVSVDGKPVGKAERTRLFAFHKPVGLLTAEYDPKGRPTIYTALRNAMPSDAGRVMPVGRLDLNTEGLLLLTNDGGLKRQMELPASGITRTYRARAFGDVSQAQLEELMDGVTIDGMRYGSIDANLERRTGRNQWIEMTITEGKNREVRKVLEYLGLKVNRLMRVSYGPFQLAQLARGRVDEIAKGDLDRFRSTLKPAAKAPSGPRPGQQ